MLALRLGMILALYAKGMPKEEQRKNRWARYYWHICCYAFYMETSSAWYCRHYTCYASLILWDAGVYARSDLTKEREMVI